jgi:hypothetical protein
LELKLWGICGAGIRAVFARRFTLATLRKSRQPRSR